MVARVLMIAPGPFFVDRGFGVSLFEQASSLQRLGLQVEVACYPSGRDVPGLPTRRAWPFPGYDAGRIGPSISRLPLWLLLLVKTFFLARRMKPDLLHAHLHEGALIAAIVSRLSGIPWLFDFQGSLSLEMAEKGALRQGSLPFRVINWLEGLVDRRAPRILVRSAAMRADLAERFGVRPDRITTIGDGTDPETFAPRPRDDALGARLRLPRDSTVIGYIGLLTEQQGIHRLLAAARSVLAEQPGCHFLIMGYPVEGFLERARELGIDTSVTFTGRVPYPDVPAHLALVDLAVAPKVSRTEGNGKLLNYAGMALPVVAIDNDVNREILGDVAYYVAGESPDAFAAGILGALNDRSNWQDRGRRLRDRLQREHTWDAVAERILAAYRAIAPNAF